MGYRSEVVFKVGPEALEELEELSSKDQKLEQLLQEMRHNALQKSDEHNVFYADWIKWYEDSDPQIKTIMKFFDRLDEEGRDDEYGFIELGESNDHIEERGSPYDLGISWSRSVFF